MASKILTIEIGNSITKICEMDYKSKKPTVYQCFHVVTPPGVLDDGIVENNPELVNAIQTALATKKVKTKQVVFSVASNKVANRDVEIPGVKGKQVQSFLLSNAQDYFPVDLSQYEVCYSKAEEYTDDAGVKKMKLTAHAVPKFLIQSYKELASSCGLSIVGLDLVGNSIARIFEGQLTEGVHLVIKIDDASCLLTVFHTNKVVFQRYAMAGVDSAVSVLQNAPDFGGKMPYVEALRRFRTMPLLNARLMTRDELYNLNQGVVSMDPTISPERAQLTQTLEDMVDGITRIVDFYNSQNSQSPIQDVYLTGIGAEFVGMKELLTNELGKMCHVVSNYGTLNLDKKIASTSVCAYSACIGSGFEPVLNISNSKKSKDGPAAPTSVDWGKVALVAFFAGTVIAGTLAFLSTQELKEADRELKAAQREYNNMVETQKMLAEYEKTEAEYENYTQMKDYIHNVHENFLPLVEKLETRMPSDFVVSSIESDGMSLTLNIKATDIISMATILQKLRYIEDFQNVHVDSYMREEIEGGSSVGFTVVCDYVPYGEKKIGTEAFEDPDLQTIIRNTKDLEIEKTESANQEGETNSEVVVEEVFEGSEVTDTSESAEAAETNQ